MFKLKHYRRNLGSPSLEGEEFETHKEAIKYVEDNTSCGKKKSFWNNDNTTYRSPEDHIIIEEI